MHINGKSILGIAVGILLLRITGFISNVWLLFGFIVLLLLWSYLLSKIPGQRKWINLGFGILVAASLFSTVGYNVYHNKLGPMFPMTNAAMTRARIAADLETSLKTNPLMFKSRAEIGNQLQALQDAIGEQHAYTLKRIRLQLNKELITPEKAWEETLTVLKHEKGFYQKSKSAIDELKISEQPFWSKLWNRCTNFGNPMISGFLILLATGIMLLIFRAFSRTPGQQKALSFAGTLLLIIGVVGAAVFCGFGKQIEASWEQRPRANVAFVAPVAAPTLIDTGATVPPYKVLKGSKKPEDPAIPLILQYPDESRTFPADRWKDNCIIYKNWGRGPESSARVFIPRSGGYTFRIEDRDKVSFTQNITAPSTCLLKKKPSIIVSE